MISLPNQLELQTLFSGFLFEAGLSAVSVKNYLSDLRHFFSFCASVSSQDNPPTVQEIFQSLSKYITLYLDEQKRSFTPINTTNRRSASIRRFSTFLESKFGLVSDSVVTKEASNNSTTATNSSLQSNDDSQPSISKILDQFKGFLLKEKKTHSTIKNYVSDLNHFFAWSASETPFLDQNLENILSESHLNTYVTYLKLSHISTSVINRRQSSVKQFTKYCFLQKYIPTNPFEYKRETPRLLPLSWFERFSSSKTKRAKNGSRSLLGVWYQKYNSLPFTPYLHLAILALASSAMVIFGYNQIIKQATPSSAALPTVPRRQLSFQGRLTDSSATPITTSVNVTFKLWNDPTAGSQLYTSNACTIVPDGNGIFNTLIGNGTCGQEIASTVFTENRDVYLEVIVGSETLTPRQQIATVGYALNSETLQGYPASASATINTVPIVDNNGDINIAAASPNINSTSGTFTLSGQALTLSTATNSGGDIVLQPDSIGGGNVQVLGGTTNTDTLRIENANLTSGALISGYVGNNTATGRLLSLTAGSTETDRFYVAASGQTKVNTAATLTNAAMIIDQNGSGNLFSASASGVTKFTIANNGNISATGTLTGLTGLTVASGTVSLPNGEINNAEISELDWTKLQNYPSACPAGQAVQAVGDTLTCVDISTYAGNLWQRTSGSVAPLYITDSLNLGSTATTSALVHLAGTPAENSWVNTGNFGIGTTTPTSKLEVIGDASSSGSLVLRGTSPSTIDILNGNRLDFQTSPGGDAGLAAKMTILGSGNVGIGTTTPSSSLEVNGNVEMTNLYDTDGTNFFDNTGTTAQTLTGIDATGALSFSSIAIAASQVTSGTFDEARVRKLDSVDSRAVVDDPEDFTSALQADFKSNSTNGLADGGSYNGVLSFRPYGSATDWTGGPMHQLSLTSNGNLWLRTSTGSTTWGSWRQIASDQMTNNFSFMGNLGIGTTAPTAKLDVVGDASSSGSLVLRGTSPSTIDILNGNRLDFQTSPGGDAGLTARMTVLGNGNVGIGDTTPASLFTVGSGDLFQVDSSGNITTAADLNVNGGDIFSSGDLTLNPTGGDVFLGASDNLGITAATNLIFGGTTSLGETTAANDSGAYLVGVFDEFAYSNGANVQDVLDDLDAAIATAGVNYWQLNAGTLTPLNITNSLNLGNAATASATVHLAGTTGENSFINTGNFGIGDTTPTATLTVGNGDLFQVAGATGNITTSGTLTLPNSNTLTGVANYVRLSQGLSVGGADTYYFNSAGTINANAGTFAGTLDANGNVSIADTDVAFDGATTTLTSTGAFTLTPGGAFTLGATTQSLVLRGTTVGITSNSAGNDITLTSADQIILNSTGTIELQDATNVTGALAGSTTITAGTTLTAGLVATYDPITISPIVKGANAYTGTVTSLDLTAARTWTLPDATGTIALTSDITSNNLWQLNAGTVTPTNITNALTLGSTASPSAIVSLPGTTNKDGFFNFGTGNFGIGTITPTAKLDIVGSASTSATLAFRGTTDPKIDILNGENLGFRTSPGGDIGLTEKLTLLNNGNFGIGNTNPSYKLDITSNSGDQMRLYDSNEDTSLTLVNSVYVGSLTYKYSSTVLSGLDFDGGNIALRSGTDTNIYMQDTGLVGIGTVAPTAKLDIVGSASTSATLAFRGTTDPKIDILNGENLGFRTSLGGDTGLTEKLTLLNNGNFGVGTTTPQGPFQVSIGATSPLFIENDGRVRFLSSGLGAYIGNGGMLSADEFGLYDAGGDVVLAVYDNISFTARYGNNGALSINNMGNVGIGTTTPGALLDVRSNNPELRLGGNQTTNTRTNSTTGSIFFPSTSGNTFGSKIESYVGGFSDDVSLIFSTNTTSTTAPSEKMRITALGYVGIGTSNPLNPLNVISPTTINQAVVQRWGYSKASNGDAAGGYNLKLKQTVTSGVVRWGFDMYNNGTAYSDMFVLDRGNVGIGVTSPSEKLVVAGNIIPSDTAGGYDIGSSTNPWGALNLNDGIYYGGNLRLSVSNKYLAGGDWNVSAGGLRIGDALPVPSGYKLWVVGNASVSGILSVDNPDTTPGAVDIVVGGGAGKIDVGMVDPPYTINGSKYATYMASMIGAKEETVGKITTSEDSYIPGLGYRTLIDLDQQEIGSNLWLFSQTTNIQSHINDLSVLLTPEGQAKAWYEVDAINKILAIYSSTPTNITFRLSAPRFDAYKWTNIRKSKSVGLVINDSNIYTNTNSIFDNPATSPELIAKIDGSYSLKINGVENKEVASFMKGIIANLQAGAAVVANLVAENLETSNLVVKTKLVSPIADIDQINAINATISGTLYANDIKGNTVDNLKTKINLLDEKYSTASAILADLQAQYSTYGSLFGATSSAIVSGDPLSLSPLAETTPLIPSDLALNSLNVHTLIANDLMTNGAIFTNSISAFDTDLYIQLADKPVHILADLMVLYPNGTVKINGDLLVTGNILAKGLDSETATVSGNIAVGSSTISTESAKFAQLTTNGLIIASGNENASGSGSTQTNSNATIGVATITAGTSEISILNTKVTPTTLIYITPTSDTQGRVLFVKSKNEGVGFTVAITGNSNTPTVSFNYWLVETK